MNHRAQKLCAWAGPAFLILFFIGAVPFADFIPPPSPTKSGEEIASLYSQDLTGIRIGMCAAILACALMSPWGAAIAARTRRTEGEFPVLTYTQLACNGAGTMVAISIPMVWGLAAFRADSSDPDITRMLNDLGWYLICLAVPPFCVWFLAIALAVFTNTSGKPLFPRWVGYFCIWVALLLLPGILVLFAKVGPFAYNGIIAFWIPFIAFFSAIVVMSFAVIQAVNRDSAQGPAEPGQVGAASSSAQSQPAGTSEA